MHAHSLCVPVSEPVCILLTHVPTHKHTRRYVMDLYLERERKKALLRITLAFRPTVTVSMLEAVRVPRVVL